MIACRLLCLFSLLLCVALMLGAGCSLGPTVRGSGVAKTESRQLIEFTKIEVGGSADVTIDVNPQQPQSVTLTTDDNILPLVETSVKGDTLVISTRNSYSTRLGLKVSIVVAAVDGAHVSGSGNVHAHGVASKSFETEVSGSGNVKVDGTADTVRISVSGSGNVDTTKLVAADATVDVSGSGNVRVNATQSLKASVSGAGDIRYTGSPAQVSKETSGSGSVRPM